MNTPAIGVREQFLQKHGDDCVNIDGVLVFSDGAMMERSAYGLMYDPPTDPWKLAKIKLRYREELLKRAVTKFTECKQQLMWKADAATRQSWSSGPSPDEIKDLEALRDKVHGRQADVTAARAAVAAAKPEIVRKDEETAASNLARGADARAAVANVKI